MSIEVFEYKSPLRKVIALLKKGRDNWKVKYQAVKSEERRLKQQNRAVEASRQHWKRRALAAEAKLEKEKKQSATTGQT